jgi:hypothetical protein
MKGSSVTGISKWQKYTSFLMISEKEHEFSSHNEKVLDVA